MKVIDSRKKEDVKIFADIYIGECFKATTDDIYMKIHEVEECYYDGWGDCSWATIANAVCLNNGRTRRFYNKDQVTPINCECVIKDN
jgi:hypothetical protein